MINLKRQWAFFLEYSINNNFSALYNKYQGDGNLLPLFYYIGFMYGQIDEQIHCVR